mmetsp:Transcript_16192/g.46875  ORF Transcript_16192/g.46875 Transcript_16192/m.46875 type:complete len:357 (+) Transcript_16192:1781-2851(+)
MVPPHEGDLGEAICRGLADARPRLPSTVRGSAVPAVHARHGDVLPLGCCRSRAQRRQLHIADHVLQDILRRLAEQERGQSERLAHGRLIAVIEAAVDDQQQGVGLGTELHLLGTLCGGKQRDGAAGGPDELQEGQLLADHGVQVALCVPVVDVCGGILVLVLFFQRHAQQQRRPAIALEAEGVLEIRAQHLRERAEVPVHRGKGRLPNEAGGLAGARVENEGLCAAILPQVASLKFHGEPAELVVFLELPGRREHLLSVIISDKELHHRIALCAEDIRELGTDGVGIGLGPEDEVVAIQFFDGKLSKVLRIDSDQVALEGRGQPFPRLTIELHELRPPAVQLEGLRAGAGGLGLAR